MTKHDEIQYIDLTPRPQDAWQAEHDRHAERAARGLLCAVCIGVLLWLEIGWLITRCAGG